MSEMAGVWQSAFWEAIQAPQNAGAFKDAAVYERLGDWTRTITTVAVTVCKSMGWQASAKGHRLELLPEARNEYLALDLMAFPDGEKQWRFPVAAMEFENSKKDDRVAYSLWKILCVQAKLRALFCYRRNPEEGVALVRSLREDVVGAMGLVSRAALGGETVVIIGNRDESATFPYGFFKWWILDTNTGSFTTM